MSRTAKVFVPKLPPTAQVIFARLLGLIYQKCKGLIYARPTADIAIRRTVNDDRSAPKPAVIQIKHVIVGERHVGASQTF